MARSDLARNVEPRLAALAEQFGYTLVDAELVREGQSRYLRIYIDKPGGITLNDCETYHHAVMPMVEQVDYDYLEVCSPGLDRPLKKEKDFLSHLGTPVEVHLYAPRDGIKQFEGTLAAFEGSTIVLEQGESVMRFPLKEVSLCRPVIEITEEDLMLQDDDPGVQ